MLKSFNLSACLQIQRLLLFGTQIITKKTNWNQPIELRDAWWVFKIIEKLAHYFVMLYQLSWPSCMHAYKLNRFHNHNHFTRFIIKHICLYYTCHYHPYQFILPSSMWYYQPCAYHLKSFFQEQPKPVPRSIS